jgi:hypothetical protein
MGKKRQYDGQLLLPHRFCTLAARGVLKHQLHPLLHAYRSVQDTRQPPWHTRRQHLFVNDDKAASLELLRVADEGLATGVTTGESPPDAVTWYRSVNGQSRMSVSSPSGRLQVSSDGLRTVLSSFAKTNQRAANPHFVIHPRLGRCAPERSVGSKLRCKRSKMTG